MSGWSARWTWDSEGQAYLKILSWMDWCEPWLREVLSQAGNAQLRRAFLLRHSPVRRDSPGGFLCSSGSGSLSFGVG
eukprot:5907662-Pyramimonas_sp.AAC.2